MTLAGPSGGGGGAWEEDWFPRETLEKPVRWWFHGPPSHVGMGNVLSKERNQAFSAFGWYETLYGVVCIVGKQADSAGAGWRLLVGTGTQDFVMYGPGGPTRLAVNSNPAPPLDGKRHFFGFTKAASASASSVTFYLDGVPVGKIVTEDTLAHTTLSATPLQIGLRGATLGIIGSVNDVSVWDRDLTASEVGELFGAGTPPNLNAVSCAVNLEAWWALDSADTLGADGVTDRSGHGLHGTASNISKGMHNVLVAAETFGGLGTTASATSQSASVAGTLGGPSAFSDLLSAYGGGAGGITTATGAGQHVVGGSGGGTLGPGANSTGSNALNAGGEPNQGSGLAGVGGGGSASPAPAFVGSNDPAEGRPATRGGGAGGYGLSGGAGRSGAQSRKGGGGGGPGGGSTSGQNGNAGGASGWDPSWSHLFVANGGANGLGTITHGLPVGTDGGDGDPGTDDHAGDGGGGGGAGDGIGARGGDGGDGGVPGGGGGGGGTARFSSGAAVTSGGGGKGARGQVTVYTYG